MLNANQINTFRRLAQVTTRSASCENEIELRNLLEEVDEQTMEQMASMTTHDWAWMTIRWKIQSLHDPAKAINYYQEHPTMRKQRAYAARKEEQENFIKSAKENGITLAEQRVYEKFCDGTLQWARVYFKVLMKKNLDLKLNQDLKIAIDFIKKDNDKPVRCRTLWGHNWFGNTETLILMCQRYEIHILPWKGDVRDNGILIVRLDDKYEWHVQNGILRDEIKYREEMHNAMLEEFKIEHQKAIKEDRHKYEVDWNEDSDSWGDHEKEYFSFSGWYHGSEVEVYFTVSDEDGEEYGWSGEINRVDIPVEQWTKEFKEEYGYEAPKDCEEFKAFVIKHLPSAPVPQKPSAVHK